MNTAFVIFMDAIKNNIANQIVASIQSFFPLSRLITGFVAVIRRRVSLVEQELPTIQEHTSPPPFIGGVMLLENYLSSRLFSCGNCIV